MAVGNPSFDALLSTTLANYRKQLADNLSRSFFLMYWLTSRERTRTENGGESIIVQLLYGKNTTVKSYDGYEPMDTTPQEGITAAKYPWKQLAATVSISGKEERQNSGESRIISLLQSKIAQAEISIRDEMNRMFFGDGTGNGSKEFFGLDLLVENGSSWGTLAGIDRSDSLNAWWRNQWLDEAGTLDIASMRTSYNTASRGNEHPDIVITTRAGYEAYEGLLQDDQRFTSKEVGDAGFENLKYKGAVMGFDEQAVSQAMFFLNSRYLEWVVDQEYNMKNTPFITPENQDARVAKILTMGNLVTSNAARQARLDGITNA
jgi:hypothetical protein